MSTAEVYARLLDKLACLRAHDRACASFGAASHRYHLEPPMSLAEVEAFERESGVALPSEYSGFLLHVGASGAGPDHGLLPLPRPGGAKIRKGCLRIVEKGCGDWEALVLRGKRRGEIRAVYTEQTAFTASSFLAWYEDWLDAGLRVWLFTAARAAIAGGQRPDAAGQGPDDVAATEDQGSLADVARFLSIFDPKGDEDPYVAMRGVALLALGRRAEAEQAFAIAEREPRPPRAFADLRDALFAEDFNDVRAAPPRDAEAHAGHRLWEIRAALAGNTAADEGLLHRLAEEESLAVRRAALENPSTGTGTLTRAFERAVAAGGQSPDAAVAAGGQRPDAAVVAGGRRPDAAAPAGGRRPDAAVVAGGRRPDGVSGDGEDTESLFTLERIALHPRTTDALRERLSRWDGEPSEDATCAHLIVRAAALGGADPEMLERLARHPAAAIRHGAAMNPRSPAASLSRLSADPDRTVRRGVAINPSSPAAMLEALARDAVSEVRAAAAGQGLSENTLIRLAAETEYSVVIAVAKNPSLPVRCREVLELSLQRVGKKAPWEEGDKPTAVDKDLEGRPGAPAHVVWPSKIYRHPSCPIALLERIVPGADDLSAYAMASHPFLTEGQIRRLGEHRYLYVRSAIAAHPRCPPDLLRELGADGDSLVRGWAARNPSMPVDQVIALSTDPDDSVRSAAGAHPEVPEAIQRQLASDPEKGPRAALLRRPDLPVDIIEQLASDPESRVRQWVPVSPRCPRAIAEVLSRDPDPDVRKSARFWLLRDDLLASIGA